MSKYTHSVSLNVLVQSNNEVPTKEELLEAFQKKVKELTLDNIVDQTELFDTEENDFELR
jgi:hypothetical protein